jgi:lipoprotein-anchoring transpeptidase ErfK/SrfK
MEEEHFSDEWDDAPMPYSIFFTPAGHAIHGSEHVKSLGRPASHGCVRLEPANAAILYTLVDEAGMANTIVVVKGGGIKRASREPEPASFYGISEPGRFNPGALY